MDQQLLQRTRYLLQIRFRRINTSEITNFHIICEQVFNWLEHHPILSSILKHLHSIPGKHHEEINLLSTLDTRHISTIRYYALSVAKKPKQENEPEFLGYTPATLEEHASACLRIIQSIIKKPTQPFYDLLAVYLTQSNIAGTANSLDILKNRAIHDLYEYLDEALDSINAVNGLLLKYKQNTEWFERESLQTIAQNGYSGKKGERALAIHLQQYLFNQGVDFAIEATSPSGEADLLLRDSSGGYAIIDAKLIDGTSPSYAKRKIAEGFNQVARYCNDYNQPEGFLAVFVNADISIRIDVENDSGFNYFKVGGRIIYYLEINIAERPSASKAKKSKEINISAQELFEIIEEIHSEQ